MNVAIFDCYSGIAGDMTVGAFLDAGFDFNRLEKELSKLCPRAVRFRARKVRRGNLSGTKFDVLIPPAAKHSHTTFPELRARIEKSRLLPPVKDLTAKILKRLVEAEAGIHGVSSSKVVLHEAGALDSLADIAGTAFCLHHWEIRKVFARNLQMGKGMIGAGTHGILPNPPPAVLELLRDFSICYAPVPFELVTPTGAAILSALSEKTESIPSVLVREVGYGAGTRDLPDRANMLRLTVGRLSPCSAGRDRILALEANLDDMNPLGFEILYERLFGGGALDVYVTPILMKKMRPAQKLTVLFEHSAMEAIARAVFRETTTFGVRFLELDRLILPRRKIRVPTKLGTIGVKVGSLDGKDSIASPEYRDCRKIALQRKLPFQAVYREAQKAAGNFLKK
ncbi:MAG TPA: nickel pincer cofactor biosynthesis protein LarC [Candidatus Omnitrophota bacterium]|nr:nickel pincer cofactor biosynthesis protein LarC [Candidatus Omnitrophota bacterium]